MLTGLCAVAVSGCQEDPGANGPAAEVVARLRAHELRTDQGTQPRPLLPPAAVEHVTRVEGGFTAVAQKRSSQSTERPARVVLPEVAQRPFQLEDSTSGMSLEVALDGAGPAKAEVVDGYVVYPDAYRDGADVLHRFTPEGTEDYLRFERAPASPEVSYRLRLGDDVAGLRLVSNTLELLDAGGAPRLRMAPPYVVDAEGRLTWAELSVEDCAVDTLPALPWGRRPVAPGARECHVRVAWSGQDMKYPAVLDPEWASTGSLINGRAVFTATLLQDGRVLAAGGYKQGYMAAAEVYDPATGTWAATSAMSQVRGFHTATRLGSGKVLVVGGANYQGSPSATAELYDPATGTWSNAAALPEARMAHAASLLGDGRVLITGGSGGANPRNAEVYDPATGAWSPAGTLTSAGYDHAGEVLPDGRVLVIGGMSASGPHTSVELYDPATGTWSLTGAMSKAREGVATTRLADGRIMVTGGNTSTTELYDPATGIWSVTGSLPESRASNTTGLLPDGRAYVLGGYITSSSPTQLTGLALYEPLTGTWMKGAEPAVQRQRHQSLLLQDGRLLVIGGETSNNTPLSSVELFTPAPRDVTPPTVTLTSPTAGSTLQNTVTLAAEVSDQSPILRVEFYDGSKLLNNDLYAPYSVSWNTRNAANGTHVLTLKAYDAAGFVGTSSEVTVTLDNDLTPPTTAITSPATGTSVQGIVTYSATASDANGVTRVEFLVNGSPVGSDSTPPYSVSWNTQSLTNGTSYTLVSRAYDPAGNAGLSSWVTVTVNNPLPPFGYDSTLKAPRCREAGARCDSGTLLNGRGPLGPEPNQPNAINGSCSDGNGGTYHRDESLDRLAVSTVDGTNLAAGKTVRIDATVWAYSSYSSDYLDLYYAPDASAPSWTFIGTLPAAASGAHVLSKTYTLPLATARAVVRGIFRYSGSAGTCPVGAYTDVDDLVFNAQ